ncbi:MAG TPA: hypothetical protein VIH77_00850, partial [Steroidobacteraceae bacterium]
MATTPVRMMGSTGLVSYKIQLRPKGFKPACHTVKVTATTDEKAARDACIAWADNFAKELAELSKDKIGAIRPDYAQMTVKKLITEYLADAETLQLRSIAGMRGTLKWWVDHYGGTHVRDMINAPTLRAARTLLLTTARGRNRRQVGRSRGTVNRHLANLRSAVTFGHVAGLLPANIVWPKKLLLKEPRGRVRFLSDAELARLLAAAQPYPVMHAVIVTAIATGLRLGELLRLTWADIDFTAQT